MTPMTAQQWLTQMQTHQNTRNWDAQRGLNMQVKQGFASRLDSQGLDAFYREALRLLDTDLARAALASDAKAFEKTIGDVLGTVRKRVQEEEDIKGVYFEYYFDGRQDDDSNSGDFFLCTDYSDDDDGWGAEFKAAGLVNGSALPDFFFVDEEHQGDLETSVLDEAADGRLLAAMLGGMGATRPTRCACRVCEARWRYRAVFSLNHASLAW